MPQHTALSYYNDLLQFGKHFKGIELKMCS